MRLQLDLYLYDVRIQWWGDGSFRFEDKVWSGILSTWVRCSILDPFMWGQRLFELGTHQARPRGGIAYLSFCVCAGDCGWGSLQEGNFLMIAYLSYELLSSGA